MQAHFRLHGPFISASSFFLLVIAWCMVMMADEAEIVAVTTLMLGCAAEVMEKEQSKKKRAQRRVWVKPWLAMRDKMGAYQALVVDFASNEHDEFHRFMRMNPETFEVIIVLYFY